MLTVLERVRRATAAAADAAAARREAVHAAAAAGATLRAIALVADCSPEVVRRELRWATAAEYRARQVVARSERRAWLREHRQTERAGSVAER